MLPRQWAGVEPDVQVVPEKNNLQLRQSIDLDFTRFQLLLKEHCCHICLKMRTMMMMMMVVVVVVVMVGDLNIGTEPCIRAVEPHLVL